MDDYSINSLTESKNEWCARLVSILSFNVIEGLKSIFEEAIKLCSENDEENKYLMTFQNLLSQIPAWNENTIENERKRIELVSKCKYEINTKLQTKNEQKPTGKNTRWSDQTGRGGSTHNH